MPRQCWAISTKLVIDLKKRNVLQFKADGCFYAIWKWLEELEKGFCMDFDLKWVPGHENDIAVVGSLKMSV